MGKPKEPNATDDPFVILGSRDYRNAMWDGPEYEITYLRSRLDALECDSRPMQCYYVLCRMFSAFCRSGLPDQALQVLGEIQRINISSVDELNLLLAYSLYDAGGRVDCVEELVMRSIRLATPRANTRDGRLELYRANILLLQLVLEKSDDLDRAARVLGDIIAIRRGLRLCTHYLVPALEAYATRIGLPFEAKALVDTAKFDARRQILLSGRRPEESEILVALDKLGRSVGRGRQG